MRSKKWFPMGVVIAIAVVSLIIPFAAKKYSAKSLSPDYVALGESIAYCSQPSPSTPKEEKVSHCNSFYIGKRVPQSSTTPVSFKGTGQITSAEIYFDELGFKLYIWLYKHDWKTGTWYGYVNTTYLPLGTHNGRVNTYVEGERGTGCATGGFKIVAE